MIVVIRVLPEVYYEALKLSSHDQIVNGSNAGTESRSKMAGSDLSKMWPVLCKSYLTDGATAAGDAAEEPLSLRGHAES